MASSPAHRYGQIIGDILELAVEPFLRDFAQKYDLFLDVKGPRPTRKGVKLSWTDLNGNSHDLDFVLEKNGSPTQQGTPAAFIETAWRRYTRHSKNKAQEIQGAIVPLVETYKDYGPLSGVILAGEFTENSLTQLRSLGFAVLYFPFVLFYNNRCIGSPFARRETVCLSWQVDVDGCEEGPRDLEGERLVEMLTALLFWCSMCNFLHHIGVSLLVFYVPWLVNLHIPGYIEHFFCLSRHNTTVDYNIIVVYDCMELKGEQKSCNTCNTCSELACSHGLGCNTWV